MKSILIIGMGRFGQQLCMNMADMGNQVMVVDNNEERVEAVLEYATGAKIGDCTNEAVLKSLGVSNFDMVFVCIGTNFQSSLEITSLVKELGAKHVISKATRDIQEKFLLKNGADEIIYPDRDIAWRAATKYGSDSVFDYMEFSEEFGVCEILPLDAWVGKSLKELDLRRKHDISILGTKKGAKIRFNVRAEHVINKEEHLIIAGEWESVSKIIGELES